MSHEVYLVEDDEAVRVGAAQSLSLADFVPRPFADAESMLAALDAVPPMHQGPVVVVTDLRLPGRDGLALLRELRSRDDSLPVILITGHGDVPLAVEAMREGAYDFIEKPFPAERLVSAVRKACEKRLLVLENRGLRAQLDQAGEHPLVGQSAAMQELRRMVAALGPSEIDVLLLGETGCGKDVAARALHAASGRRGPFVAINCGALPETVFESEVFGHEAGAFTGAQRRRIGKFEYAHGGTLFLDEIESMPLALQVKLLRALQERSIERLGGNAAIAVDCRVIAATKTDLARASEDGRFRADLYYRLDVATLRLPPLRERLDDLPLLMAHFLQLASRRYGRPVPSWTPADMERWQRHRWPGNVRELRNVADRWCMGLPDGLPAVPASLPPADPRPVTPAGDGPLGLVALMDRAERAHIEAALQTCDGQVAKAAELLQLPRKTLYDKLHRHGIEAERFRRGGVS